MSEIDDGLPEFTESERIRIQATESDFASMGDALRNGTATPEDVEGALARFMSLDIDPQKRRNALHIPAEPDRMRRRSRPSCAGSPTAGDAGSASTPAGTPWSSPPITASPSLMPITSCTRSRKNLARCATATTGPAARTPARAARRHGCHYRRRPTRFRDHLRTMRGTLSTAENPLLGENALPFLRRATRIRARVAARPGVAPHRRAAHRRMPTER